MPVKVPVPVPSNSDVMPLSFVSGSASDGHPSGRRMCVANFVHQARDPIVTVPSIIVSGHATNTTLVTPRAARPILGSAANLNPGGQHMADKSTGNQPASSPQWEQDSSCSLPASKQSPLAGDAGLMLTSLCVMNGSVPTSQPASATVLPNGVDAAHCSVVSDQSVPVHLAGIRPPSASNAPAGWQSDETSTLPIAYQYISQSADKPLLDSSPSSNPMPVLPASPNDSSSPGPAVCSHGCCQCGQCPLPNVPPPLPVGNFATYSYSPVMFPTAPTYLPAFGYIPSLSFPPPPLGPVPFSSGYTQSADLIYTNPTMFAFVQHQQRPLIQIPHAASLPPPPRGMVVPPPLGAGPVLAVPFNPSMPPPNHTIHQLGGGNGGKRVNAGGKSLSCYNCGNVGHLAIWCPEPKIQSSMAPLGEFRFFTYK